VRLDVRFIKFLMVGALNTLFGLGIYALLIHAGVPIWSALIGGNVAGIVFNFFTTGHLIFSTVAVSRAPRFVVAYLACYAINYLALAGFAWLHMGPIESQVVLTPFMAVVSYVLMSRYVFRSDQP